MWQPETPTERRAAEEELKKINDELEPIAKEEWELANGMRRMGLRNLGDKKPKWRWDEDHGKVIRKGKKGGIDWYRYQKKVLILKLLTFAKEHKKEYSGTQVQENKAPSHNSKYQHQIWMDANILRFLWPGNSPDLNMIEPCWP